MIIKEKVALENNYTNDTDFPTTSFAHWASTINHSYHYVVALYHTALYTLNQNQTNYIIAKCNTLIQSIFHPLVAKDKYPRTKNLHHKEINIYE